MVPLLVLAASLFCVVSHANASSPLRIVVATTPLSSTGTLAFNDPDVVCGSQFWTTNHPHLQCSHTWGLAVEASTPTSTFCLAQPNNRDKSFQFPSSTPVCNPAGVQMATWDTFFTTIDWQSYGYPAVVLWTGANAFSCSSAPASSTTCNDWSSSSSSMRGTAGFTESGVPRWWSDASIPCNTATLHLLCACATTSPPTPPTPAPTPSPTLPSTSPSRGPSRSPEQRANATATPSGASFDKTVNVLTVLTLGAIIAASI